MTKMKKIKATYRNGVIEPLVRIDLPEGQELEVEFRVLQKTPCELTREEKKRIDPEDKWLNERDMGEAPLKKLTLISNQKDNHGIENFRFFHSQLSYSISVVGYLCAYIFSRRG